MLTLSKCYSHIELPALQHTRNFQHNNIYENLQLNLPVMNIFELPRYRLCGFFSLVDWRNGGNGCLEQAVATTDEDITSHYAHLELMKPSVASVDYGQVS